MKTVKTRFCIISDTHTAELRPLDDKSHAYREPLPSADVLLHAGDITMVGYIHEYESMVDMFSKAHAELKIVIAGNHDVTLDEPYYEKIGKRKFHRNIGEDLEVVREMWTGEHAKQAGIVYLDEGVRTFTLSNGARFTVRSGSRFSFWHRNLKAANSWPCVLDDNPLVSPGPACRSLTHLYLDHAWCCSNKRVTRI